ncbi:hypothetical protein T265_05946 [Opisthorchis viverrini]|uniref:F-box domain-containing protein n=1 Tax=Opisthorchis viverrini TaxID=6198 RepID=A0A075AEN1_OPIVI|nr:hypothetical protein T265_05946 [Opisthorchis viverrini]KER26889.1 hypothetical protein T265_05946 [Opisthorchis viverrini]
MERQEPTFYSYSSLFPSNVTDLFPEQSCMPYNLTSVAGQSDRLKRTSQSEESIYSGHFVAPKWNPSSSSGQSLTVCPGCFTQVCDDSNWCSACGELLIGSSLCSSDLESWSHQGLAFRSLHPALNEPVKYPSEWHAGASTQSHDCVPSYPVAENHVPLADCSSYTFAAVSSIPLSQSFTAASFVTAPSFAASFTSVSCPTTEFDPSVAQPSSHSFHIAETSAPICHSQMESLQSTLNELHLGHGRYIRTGAQEYGIPCPGNYSPMASTLASFPNSVAERGAPSMVASASVQYDPSQLLQSVNQRVRQRCISGPVDVSMVTTRNGVPGDLQFDFVPVVYPIRAWRPVSISSNGSQVTPNFPTQAQLSWGMSQSANLCVPRKTTSFQSSYGCHVTLTGADMFNCPGGTSAELVDSREKCCMNTRPNNRRRKNPSECSRAELKRDYAGPRSYGRTRSFSSDVQPWNGSEARTGPPSPSKPVCHWQMSRTAWSAHDPSLAKKKSSDYLRASYSHRTCATHNQSSVKPEEQITDKSIETAVRTNHTRACAQSSNRHQRFLEQKQQRRNGGERRRNRGTRVGSFGDTQTVGYRPSQPQLNAVPKKAVKSRRLKQDINCHSKPERLATTGQNSDAVSEEHVQVPTDSNQTDPATEHSPEKPNWMLLPNELWIAIIHHLPFPDRARLALVCRRLSNLVFDPSLWRVIQLHRHQHLTNTALASIGRLRPRELRLTYCHGDTIAADGLRQLFQACGPSLRKLSFIGCTKGLFDYDLPLLLAAKHCPNMSHINASYTQAVRDQTVIALAKSALHLVSVKLNGAQQISNSAIQQLVHYHKDTLQRLELFGCFRLNSDIFAILGRCQQLRALAFGHLHHLSSDGLLELVGKLPLLSSLDLRGTQTLSSDLNLSRLADKCPHLEEVVLANMHSLKHEAGIAQMLRRLPRLRVLDLCGLGAVGDLTMEALASGCPQLEELDVSCTSVTQKGLSHLTLAPAKSLRCLRISHCREITRDVLEKLVKACTKLTILYAYGFKSISDWSFLQAVRPALLVESDV